MKEQHLLLNEQIEYYAARAPEYDEWFFRRGRYDRGEEHRTRWMGEIKQVSDAVEEACRDGEVLELACGTGLWTQRLAPRCHRVTAVDASPETIKLCRELVQARNVDYILADIFRWTPPQTYDFLFFGFWLSHVPSILFDEFWALARRALKPTGSAFFVDSLFTDEAPAKDHGPIDRTGVVERKLNDGRVFKIVKLFYEPTGLEDALRKLGWETAIRTSDEFFIYGTARPQGECGEHENTPGK